MDKEGNPGFVSESTGEPADLFHVVFPDQPHHTYAAFLLAEQDLEGYEVEANLLEETASAKRKREAAVEAAEKDELAREKAKRKAESPAKGKKRRRRS